MNDPVTSNDRIGLLAEEYLERHRRGLEPSVEAYAEAHPELADEIRRLFPALLMMEDLKPASGDETGSFAGVAVVVRGARLERLGDFRILREVGRGGMGVVYEAEQESLGRRVALKVLTIHSLSDPALLARFGREARAAARLHHTNIVPVFGVGEQDGLHYYVMQFIQGLGLDEVIGEVARLRSGRPRGIPAGLPGPDAITATSIAHSLMAEHFVPATRTDDEASGRRTDGPGEPVAGSSADATLASSGLSSLPHSDVRYFRSVARIGLQVARALDYSHTQGVFHRDVKPSNLLLDLQGTAWVADFGLAKAVEADDLTHTGDIVGTIRYMAPERFRGRCDARSDVYALGLTLYEMLALRPAFAQADRHELIRQVMEEEPAPLRKHEPAVPRDLETVIHKAIAKDPAGRYPAASALADDLALYLDGKPVRARRVGVLERAWKWTGRHPAVAALATGLVAAVVAGLASVTWQWRAAVAARDEAQQTLRMANDAVDTYFTQVSEEHLLDEPGMQPLRERLLRLALPYYQALASQKADDPARELRLANAYLRWGTITGQIGSRGESKRLLRTAVARFEELVRADPNDLETRAGLARASLELAYQEIFTDQPDQGSRTARRAAGLWEEVVRSRPDDREAPQMLGRSLSLAAVGLDFTGRLVEARSEHQRAILVLRGAVGRSPGDAEGRRKLARALNNLGVTQRLLGDPAGAERTHDEARAEIATLLAARPSSALLRKDMAGTLRLLGHARLLLGALRRAEADLEGGLGVIEGVVRENPEVIEYRYIRGEIFSLLGQVCAGRGKTARAKGLLQADIALEREILSKNPSLVDNLMTLADSSLHLASVERETGHLDQAALHCDEAVGIIDKLGAAASTATFLEVTFGALTEAARLAVRRGPTRPDPVDALRTLLRRWEERAPADPAHGGARHMAAEAYLALGEIAARSDATREVPSRLAKAEALVASAPDGPRSRSLRARIETSRGFAAAGASRASEAAAAAGRAVAIAEALAGEDPSYLYDLACARALQSALDPRSTGPPAAAVRALRGAVEAGFDNRWKLEHDDRLASIRGRDDFREVTRLLGERAGGVARGDGGGGP